MAIRVRSTALVLALVLVAGVAHAKDFCFNSSSPSGLDFVVVAQRFRVPRPGNCAPIVGFEFGTTNFTFPRPASGTACTDSAGTRLHVGIMIHSAYGPPPISTDSEIHMHMNLPYPALTDGPTYIRRDLPLLAELRPDGFAGPCGFPITIP